MKRSFRHLTLIPLCVLGMLLAACGGGGGILSLDGGAPPTRVLSGRTSFVSADLAPPASPSGLYDKALPAAAPSDSGTRTVAQGDIFRVLDSGRTVLNLNTFRGLQVLDLTDPAHPAITGRAALSGYPVEMYVAGNRVYALMNNWIEARRVLKDGKETLEQYNGGALVTIDIANRKAPRVVSARRVAGNVVASRMSSGGGHDALYVASVLWGAPAEGYPGSTSGTTAVNSFGIDAQGDPQPRTSLSLAGSSAVVQAAGDRLLIARGSPTIGLPVVVPPPGSAPTYTYASTVSVIDISSPEGVMRQGGDIQAAGSVAQKNNLHVQGNVVRVVSADPLARANIVETFDIADLAHPRKIDSAQFGANQQLYGTTFLADRAFFVTYERKDPFHAFSISADGHVKEESQFIVSGWNDFFTPAFGGTRLVGIGHNDEQNRRTLAVSLYDIVDLKNAKPLLARAEISLDNGWSEASWDDRGFTVLDNGANALAADGKTRETGLVLLPFAGFDNSDSVYKSGVQIFTYSATTLTRRGAMSQETQVRRSFLGSGAPNTAVNLSDTTLSTFDIGNPAAPERRGALTLAQSYNAFVAVGNVGVRSRSNLDSFGLSRGQVPADALDVVPLDDPETVAPLATISVPSGAKIFSAAGKLVVVGTRDATKIDPAAVVITTYDLGTPSRPVKTGELVTAEIEAGYPTISAADIRACLAFVPCGPRVPVARVVGNALVFTGGDAQYLPAADTGLFPRYWSNYTFRIVDLTDAAKPALLPKIVMSKDEEAVDLVQDGATLWISYKKAETVAANATEPTAKYYVKALNLAQPATAQPGPAINVPGRLLAARGATLFTIEGVWTNHVLANSFNMLEVQGGLAYLQASVAMGDRFVTSALVDGNTLYAATTDSTALRGAVVAYAIGADTLTEQGRVDVTPYPTMEGVRAGHLLVRANGGFLLYDFTQPKAPFAQAFVAGYGAEAQFAGSRIYVPGYAYGIYAFDFGTANLAAP